jgi:hypothetical protein
MKLVARIAEIQMNKAQMFSLSLVAVLAGPVHAQVCSGGNDGGIDATGNQCNWPSEVAAFTTGPATSPQAQVTRLGSVQASAKHPAIRLAQMSGQKSTPIAMAVPASMKLRAAAPPSVSAKTAKTGAGLEAFCSGGAGGGMDANGAECGEASALTEISVVAQHKVR